MAVLGCGVVGREQVANSRKRGGLLIIFVIALLIGLAAGVGVYIAQSPTASTTVTPITPITPAGQDPPTAVPSADPPPSSTRHDTVAPFFPSGLSVEIPGEKKLLDNIPIDKQPLMMERSGPSKGWVIPRKDPGVFIDPAINWSVLPGTSAGTTMIFGHAQDDSDQAFNPLTMVDPETAEAEGYQATLVGETAELTYSVVDVFLVHKGELKNWEGLKTNEPGRLVLVTCNLEVVNGVIVDTYDSIVWVFKLSSSVSKS